MRGSSAGALQVLAAAASKQKKKGTRARAGVSSCGLLESAANHQRNH
jgi:hypothetical protein